MDHLKRSALNGFTAYPMDRFTAQREDSPWIEQEMEDPRTRFVLVWRSRNLFSTQPSPRPVWLSSILAQPLLPSAGSTVFLGQREGRSYFALDLPGEESDLPALLPQWGEFKDLRIMGPILDHSDAAILAYAKAITHWHKRHRFCGDCGSPTASTAGGHVRTCSNAQCGASHFPRTDPAVIVQVSSREHCLLGRQRTWPERMYSVIAGFVEPGESLEDAVLREVREETGIEVQTVHYHSSQPWPFPGSIMLGFKACAPEQPVRLGDDELEDARWFSREEIREGLVEGSLRLPLSLSIAYRLIEDWFDAAGEDRLEDLMEPSRHATLAK